MTTFANPLLPSRETARRFARGCFESLARDGARIRLNLCRLVELCAVRCAADEDIDVLRAAAYFQEVGAVHSSRDKAVFSLQMLQAFFRDSYAELDPRLVDCVANHVRSGRATTAEARLMQICHKYVVTHYLDYMLLKSRISEFGFEKLQLERIEAYSKYLTEHPRGPLIDARLQGIFYEDDGRRRDPLAELERDDARSAEDEDTLVLADFTEQRSC